MQPIRRLWRTLDRTLRLSFGDSEDLRRAARQINRAHRAVQGPGYRAVDPALLLWVHATLIDSALERAYRLLEVAVPASRGLPEPLRELPIARRAARRARTGGLGTKSATRVPPGWEV